MKFPENPLFVGIWTVILCKYQCCFLQGFNLKMTKCCLRWSKKRRDDLCLRICWLGLGNIFHRCCKGTGIWAAEQLMQSCWTDARTDIEYNRRHRRCVCFLDEWGHNPATMRTYGFGYSENMIIQSSLQKLAFCCNGLLPIHHSARPPERILPPMGWTAASRRQLQSWQRTACAGKGKRGPPTDLWEKMRWQHKPWGVPKHVSGWHQC